MKDLILKEFKENAVFRLDESLRSFFDSNQYKNSVRGPLEVRNDVCELVVTDSLKSIRFINENFEIFSDGHEISVDRLVLDQCATLLEVV